MVNPLRTSSGNNTGGQFPAMNVDLKFIDAVLSSDVPMITVSAHVKKSETDNLQRPPIFTPGKARRVVGRRSRLEDAIVRHNPTHDLAYQRQ